MEVKPRQLGLFQAAIPDYEMVTNRMNNAFVQRRIPNTVFYDPRIITSNPEVFSHEFEHQLDAKATNAILADFKKGNKNYTEKDIRKIKSFALPVFNFLKILEQEGYNENDRLSTYFKLQDSLASDKVSKRLNEILPERKGSSFGRIGVSKQPLHEYFADLSGLETEYGVDLTQDPVIRKEVFNDDPKIIQAYKAVTGLRQTRLDAKDIAPYTYVPPPKTFRERIVDLFTNPLMQDTTR